MKTVFTIILFLYSLNTQSQSLILQSSHNPKSLDSFDYYRDTLDYNIPSENPFFDFSFLNRQDSFKYIYSKNEDTTFSNSNLIFNIKNSSSTQNQDLIFYYNTSDSNQSISGLKTVIMDRNVIFKLNNKLVNMSFPISVNTPKINTNDSSYYSLPASVIPQEVIDSLSNIITGGSALLQLKLDSIQIKLNINEELMADINAKLKMSDDSLIDVLRVVNKFNFKYTIKLIGNLLTPLGSIQIPDIDLAQIFTDNGLSIPTEINITVHRYYNDKIKNELLNCMLDSTNTKYSTIDFSSKKVLLPNLILNNYNNNNNLFFSIINDNLIINNLNDIDFKAFIYDNNGKKILYKNLEDPNVPFELKKLKNSICFIVCLDKDNNIILKEKFTKK